MYKHEKRNYRDKPDDSRNSSKNKISHKDAPFANRIERIVLQIKLKRKEKKKKKKKKNKAYHPLVEVKRLSRHKPSVRTGLFHGPLDFKLHLGGIA